jgi:hypothetical protein
MGGDVNQWTEANIDGVSRGLRGGSWYGYSGAMVASCVDTGHSPAVGSNIFGFRVASESVPEPSTLVLLGIGAVSLLAYAWRKRRRISCGFRGRRREDLAAEVAAQLLEIVDLGP